jgi:hypothetical protein
MRIIEKLLEDPRDCQKNRGLSQRYGDTAVENEEIWTARKSIEAWRQVKRAAEWTAERESATSVFCIFRHNETGDFR